VRKILLITFLLSLMCTMLVAQTAGGAWQKLNLPPAMVHHLRSVFAAPDGYVYVGSDAGIYRASVKSPTAWAAVNSGLPKTSTGYQAATALGVTKKGTLLAGLGFSPEVGIWRFNPTTRVWTKALGSIYPSTKFTSFTFDSAGKVYATDSFAGNVYVSTDDGVSFKRMITNAYNYMGQRAGAIWIAKVITDGTIQRMYWGGEGGLNVTTLDFRQNQAELTNAQGYNGNLLTLAASNNELLVSRLYKGTSLQRFDFLLNRWTSIGSAQGIPAYWDIYDMAYVPATREYFASAYSSTTGGILRSTNGGKTWSSYNTGMTVANTKLVRRMSVSPVNQSKYVLMGNDVELWYHP
jgi:photosystem II stability/assembly factor-like uncharacterized protein